MNYRIEEILYGPEIRFNDWRVEKGKKERAGGCAIFFGDSVGDSFEVQRDDYPYGGGGNVAIEASVVLKPPRVIRYADRDGDTDHDGDTGHTTVEEPNGAADGWTAAVHLNYVAADPERRGFFIEIDRAGIRVKYRGTTVGQLDRDIAFDLLPYRIDIGLATLDERYSLEVDGVKIAEGVMERPFHDNEGWTRLSARGVEFELFEYAEYAIVDDEEFPQWERGELLYRERFAPETFEDLWFVNADANAPPTVIQPGSYTIRHMSNAFLRKRFESPVVIDFAARPVPNPRFSSGVTDAIFVWMADSPDGDLLDLLEEQNRSGEASLKMLLPCPFYWVDFGGTNNNTTRLRKNPYRHLMRQYTDRPRLLAPDHAYRITVVQYGEFLEFHVDNKPMIRCRDPHPHIAGHIGVRAFVTDLELNGLEVYRARTR
jgi:hypothetical protein